MKTQELLTSFLDDCEERGLSPNTRRTYWGFLRHFVDEHPQLPTDTDTINQFLKKRKETPARRGPVFKNLQAFYSYLVKAGILDKSPVPPKGLVGRPRKFKPAAVRSPGNPLPGLPGEKLVQGGSLRIVFREGKAISPYAVFKVRGEFDITLDIRTDRRSGVVVQGIPPECWPEGDDLRSILKSAESLY